MTCYIIKNVLTPLLAFFPDNLHILSYPKAVSDSMQKEIGHKTNKKKEKNERSTERKH